jgi:hypothetical protein
MNVRAALSAGVSLAVVCLAVPASAHISLEQGGTHLSRYGDSAASIKAGPCGRTGGTRGTHIYTYEPGQTITVKVVETIAHPGYFRIAFDNDGDNDFKEPASIKPVDPKRACPDGPGDHCGTSDFYNNATVLPGMDNLNPHLASGTPTYTWQVTLPNVECQNCTLQVIQVMEDDTFHGPYDPTPGVGVEDIYHQCIDLVLAKGSGDGGLTETDAGTSSSDAGSIIATDGGAGGGGGGGGGGGTGSGADGGTNEASPGAESNSGGCSTSGTSGTNVALGAMAVALGLSAVRRRSRRNTHR